MRHGPPLRDSKRRSNLAMTDPDADFGGGGYRGNFFCNEKLVQPIKLAWSGDKKPTYAVTTVRPLPGKHPDDPSKWDTWRVAPSDPSGPLGNGLGDFIRRFMAWRRAGNPNVTFFLYNPADLADEEAFDKWNNPAFVLAMAAKQSVKRSKGPQVMAAMLDSGFGRSPVIKFPGWMYVMQGLVYEHGTDKDSKVVVHDPPLGIADDDRIPLIDLGADGGVKVIRSCEELADGLDEDDLPPPDAEDVDWSEFYKNGDPVGMKRGTFMRFFPSGGIDPREVAKNQVRSSRKSYTTPVRRGGQGAHRDVKPGDDKIKGFEMFCQPEFDGLEASFSKDIAKSLRRRTRPWSEVLKFLDEEQQVRTLAGSMRWKDPDDQSREKGVLCLDVLHHVWGKEHPEWVRMIPDELDAEFKKRKGILVPRSSEEDDEEEEEAPARPARRSHGKLDESMTDDKLPAEDDDDDDDDDDEDEDRKRPLFDKSRDRRTTVAEPTVKKGLSLKERLKALRQGK